MEFKVIRKIKDETGLNEFEVQFSSERSLIRFINRFNPSEAKSGESVSIYIKPRAVSPVWHYALSYNLSTPDMVNYCKSNVAGALSHYYHLYAQLYENEDQ